MYLNIGHMLGCLIFVVTINRSFHLYLIPEKWLSPSQFVTLYKQLKSVFKTKLRNVIMILGLVILSLVEAKPDCSGDNEIIEKFRGIVSLCQ